MLQVQLIFVAQRMRECTTFHMNQNTRWPTRQYTNATILHYSNPEKRNANPISNQNKDLYRLCVWS